MTYAQMFIRKDILLHMTVIPTNKSNKVLFDKSISQMEELLDYSRFQPYYYLLLSGAYTKSAIISNNPSFLKLAEDSYKKALELSPKQQKIYYAYGQFLLDQHRESHAREILKQALDFAPEAPLSNFHLGLAEMTSGQSFYAEALDHMEVFFESDFPVNFENHFLNPDPGWIRSQDAYKKLLAYFYDKKDKEKVLIIAKRLSELDKSQSAAYGKVAKIISDTGQIPVIEFTK